MQSGRPGPTCITSRFHIFASFREQVSQTWAKLAHVCALFKLSIMSAHSRARCRQRPSRSASSKTGPGSRCAQGRTDGCPTRLPCGCFGSLDQAQRQGQIDELEEAACKTGKGSFEVNLPVELNQLAANRQRKWRRSWLSKRSGRRVGSTLVSQKRSDQTSQLERRNGTLPNSSGSDCFRAVHAHEFGRPFQHFASRRSFYHFVSLSGRLDVPAASCSAISLSAKLPLETSWPCCSAEALSTAPFNLFPAALSPR
jgi:hypothetical protein